MTLERDRNASMISVSVMTVELDRANAQYCEMFGVSACTAKERSENKYKPTDGFEKLRELFDQGRKVDVPSHPVKLSKRMAEIALLKNDSDVK